MQTIDQALKEICNLHEQLLQSPAPEIGPQAFMPMPPGVDPVAYAIEEVSRLKELVETAQSCPNQSQTEQPTWAPCASIHAGESTVVISVEIPGVDKEDVQVSVVDGQVVVRGARRPPEASNQLRPMVVEQMWGAFERRFPVPPWCNTETIRAGYNQGVLEINLTRLDGGTSTEVRVEIA